MKKKFKVWCNGNSENPNFNKSGWWDSNNIVLNKYFPSIESLEKYPAFKVVQFTGKLDIEGKEIYEGDYVELHYAHGNDLGRGLYEVFWGNCGFELKCHKKAWGDVIFQLPEENKFQEENGKYFVPSKVVIDTMPLGRFNICKVIGNIFEGIKA